MGIGSFNTYFILFYYYNFKSGIYTGNLFQNNVYWETCYRGKSIENEAKNHDVLI